jgi:hypothetical protein
MSCLIYFAGMKTVVVSPICDNIWSGATPVTLVSNILVPLGGSTCASLDCCSELLAGLFCCIFLILAPLSGLPSDDWYLELFNCVFVPITGTALGSGLVGYA